MAYLLVGKGEHAGERLRLDKDRILLGRDGGCDIILSNSMVSHRHAVISRRGAGYFIQDGDGHGRPSRNKTFVNGVPVPVPGRVPLRNNDHLRICDFEWVFHEDNPAAPGEEAEPPVSLDSSISRIDTYSVLETQPAEKLRIILELSVSLAGTLERTPLLTKIVESLFRLFPKADRGFLVEPDEASGELAPTVARTRKTEEQSGARPSLSLVRQCLQGDAGLLLNGAQIPITVSLPALSVQSVLCAPLRAQDGKALGAIQLDTRNPAKKFTQEDLKLLMGVAGQASVALANARLYRDSLERERLRRDLELARVVQSSFLPQELPTVAGYQFFADYEPALVVGGDYYDFVPLAGQRLAILLGDVAGKGMPAALVTARLAAEARTCLLSEPEPAAAVRRLNAAMQRLAETDRFVTLIVAVLDPAAHTVTLVNAGHPSPLLVRHTTRAVEEAASPATTGIPIGLVDSHEYVSCQVQLGPGDSLILFSDGVTESMDAQNKLLGTTGVEAVLRQEAASPAVLGERIRAAVERHSAGCPQRDDITLVCFGRV